MITIGDTSWLRPLEPPPPPSDTAWLRPLEQAPGAGVPLTGPIAYAPSLVTAGARSSSSVSLLSNLQSLRSAMGSGVAIARPISSGMPGTVPSVPAGPPTLDRSGGGYERAPAGGVTDGIPTAALVAGGVVVAGLAYFLLRRK